MATHTDETPGSISLEPDHSWSDKDLPRLDPGLDQIVELLEHREWDQVYARTGMQLDSETTQRLPLLLEMAWADLTADDALTILNDLGLDVPGAYLSVDRSTHITARIAVEPRESRAQEGKGSRLRQQIVDILQESRVVRVELPPSIHAFNADALSDIGLGPGTRTHKGEFLDGAGVVIGIIDDGCALANRNFMKPHTTGAHLESRILALWDQARDDPTGGWQAAPGSLGGLELTKAVIDTAIQSAELSNGDAIDEDAVYRKLNYAISDLASHGTHVMDIAAGNGCAPMATEGVAPAADIIFVQLPAAAIASGGAALANCILDGITYIFAKAGAKPTVINISYGGYAGPHDGSSIVEAAIDTALVQPDRAVVVAAGNGYEADCHAHGLLPHQHDTLKWRWVVKPQDPTPNDLEIWYNGDAELELRLTAPDGSTAGPVTLGAPPQRIKIGSKKVGRIRHKTTTTGDQPNLITIRLNQTTPKQPGRSSDPAPPGTWEIRLENTGTVAAKIDAWIERDTSGRPGGARRQQSHFHPDDADVRGTLASYATGRLAVAVGAYNTATHEVCRYSACGPTRDGRNKPDILAPAEEDAAGGGILCASSRSALPTRMNGTSASAPQVTGLVALLFQYATSTGATLSAETVLYLLRAGAKAAPPALVPLRSNRHVDADANRKVKQEDVRVWPELTGDGMISWPYTITLM